MTDQAQSLRHLIQQRSKKTLVSKTQTKVVTVTSGKGGVGKSNFTINFALALRAKGLRVLIFDADMGLANLDVLMGVTPKYHLYHLFTKERSIQEIVQDGPNGIQLIAGGSGFNELLSLSEEQLSYFMKEIQSLNGTVDYIIFDTGAGLSKESINFILSSEQTIVVTTPEPTSITDAYAIIKMVSSMNHSVDFRLVVNRTSDHKEGNVTAEKIRLVSNKFLKLDIRTLGYVSDDSHVSKAVKKQIPFWISYPNCAASRDIKIMADRFTSGTISRKETYGMKGFLNKMIRLMR